MNILVALLARLYRELLGLYPPVYQLEFGEELREVFEQAFQDSCERNSRYALRYILRELRDLPGVLLRTHLKWRQTKMVSYFFPQTNDQTPWPTAVLSLIPYIILGPLAMVMSYHPWWKPEQLPWLFPCYMAAAVLATCLSFIIGIIRKFPRWSYPSAIYLILMLTYLVTYLVNRTPWDVNHEVIILLLVAGLSFLAAWRLKPLKPFLDNLKLDWTTLSYGMYACTLLLVSTQDHDEVPYLNLIALLPSLIWLAGALAHLRLTAAKLRVGVLILSILLGTAIMWLPVFDGMSGSLAGFLIVLSITLVMATVLSGLVLAPILIGVVKYNRQPRPTNTGSPGNPSA